MNTCATPGLARDAVSGWPACSARITWSVQPRRKAVTTRPKWRRWVGQTSVGVDTRPGTTPHGAVPTRQRNAPGTTPSVPRDSRGAPRPTALQALGPGTSRAHPGDHRRLPNRVRILPRTLAQAPCHDCITRVRLPIEPHGTGRGRGRRGSDRNHRRHGRREAHTIAALVAHLLETGTPPGHIVCLTVRSEGSADLRLWLENHHRTRVTSQSERSFTSPHAALLLCKSSET